MCTLYAVYCLSCVFLWLNKLLERWRSFSWSTHYRMLDDVLMTSHAITEYQFKDPSKLIAVTNVYPFEPYRSKLISPIVRLFIWILSFGCLKCWIQIERNRIENPNSLRRKKPHIRRWHRKICVQHWRRERWAQFHVCNSQPQQQQKRSLSHGHCLWKWILRVFIEIELYFDYRLFFFIAKSQ